MSVCVYEGVFAVLVCDHVYIGTLLLQHRKLLLVAE